MTPEREKFLRDRIQAEESIGWDGVKELLDEIDRLRRIIAKELSENDELGAEYTYVHTLKERLNVARDALYQIQTNLSADISVGGIQAEKLAHEALAKIGGGG